MKNPFESLKGYLSELKGRTLLIFIVVIVLIIMLLIFMFGGSGDNITTAQKPGSSTIRAPRLESTPGVSKVNDQAYVQLQQQANQQKAEQAINAGNSAVATVTSNQYVNELSIPEPGLASIGGRPASPAALDLQERQQNESLMQYQRLHQQQVAQEQAREQERIQQEQAKQQEAYQDAFESLMQSQVKSLMGQWQAPSQSYVRNGNEGGNQGSPPSSAPHFSPLYKAGDIIFGVMETAVNSDEPGPVLVRVVSGPLTGAKLIGSFRRVEDQVFIEFSLLNAPNVDMSVPVKAVAIDPETARTALATGVDHHRLLRYGTLFASAFLQGVGEAVLAGIQPNFIVDGSTFSVTNVESTTKDQILVGIGEVGTKLGDKLDPIFNTPPTVTVDSGTAVGLLFLQDFVLQPQGNNMIGGATASRPIQIIEEQGSSLGNLTSTSFGGASATTASSTTNTGTTNQSTNSTVKSQ